MRRLLLVALLAAALLPAPSRAYELHTDSAGEPLYWASFPVGFRLGPTQERRTERLRLLRRGFEAWVLPKGSPVAFSYEGVVQEAFAVGDERSSAVVLEAIPWPPELGDSRTVAGATVHLLRSGTAELIEVDIGINAVEFRWADESSVPDALDLWSVVTHEVGHLLGLDHVCDGSGPIACSDAGPRLLGAAMFPAASPGDVSRREPAADDLAGLVSLYGPGVEPAPLATVLAGGCPPEVRVIPAEGVELVEVAAVHAETGHRILLGTPDPEDGHLLLPETPLGLWDLTLIASSGKERTTFAAFEVADCPPPKVTGCASTSAGIAGGGGSSSAHALGLALVLALGLSRGRAGGVR